MIVDKKNWVIVFFIFLFALSIGNFYLEFMPAFPLTGDAVDYDIIAQNLTRGQGYALENGIPTSRRAPGYPFFLAGIYGLFGHNHEIVKIFQILLLAGIGIIVYLIAKKYLKLSMAVSFLASIITVFWPYFILYSTLILTEILFTFFLFLSVYFLLKFCKEKTYKTGLILGAVLGITMLIRPCILLLPVWLCIFLFIFLKMNKKSFEWKKIILFVLIAFLIISPWTIRNFLQFNSFIPISSGLDQSLSRAFVKYDYTQDSTALKPGEAGLKTLVSARIKNIYLFWNPGAEGERAQTLIEKYPWINSLFSLYKILFLTIVGLALLSLKFIKRKKIFLLWAVIFYFWALYIILYPYPRYTLPVMPLVILLALFSLSNFIKPRCLKILKSS
jgi:4-amino-4-deoxy-L-arabinose transferase-like glycosyltransferase